MKTESKIAVVPKTGAGLPKEHVEAIADILRAAEAGELDGFVLVAVGVDFNSWREGYVRGKADRMNLLGQLRMAARAIEDADLE